MDCNALFNEHFTTFLLGWERGKSHNTIHIKLIMNIYTIVLRIDHVLQYVYLFVSHVFNVPDKINVSYFNISMLCFF